MEEKAIRGIPWTLLAYATNRGLTLATMVVLARLLAPDDFGVVAFGLLAGQLMSYFFTLGLAPTVVIRQDLHPEALGTALVLLAALTLVAAGLLAGLAPVAADLLDQPGSSGVLAALAVPVALGGVSSFYWAVMQRELQFSRLFVAHAAQVAAFAAVSILLAILEVGAWSLVGGQAAGVATYATTLYVLAPYRVRPAFDPASLRPLWRSSRGFMLQGGFSFLEQNADYLVVGSALGARQLGFYSMSYRITELPYLGIVDPVCQATFPGYARMRHRAEDVSGPLFTSLRLISLCALPMGLVLSGAAEPFVNVVLGAKWEPATGLLAILGVWGSVRVLQGTVGWFVNAMGFASRLGVSYALLLVVSLPLLVVGANKIGVKAVAWVMVGNMVVMLGIVFAIAHRQLGIPAGRLWHAVRASVIASVPAWIVARVVSEVADGGPPALVLAAALVASVGTYFAVVTWAAPGLPREAAEQIARIISRRRAVPMPPLPASDPAGETR